MMVMYCHIAEMEIGHIVLAVLKCIGWKEDFYIFYKMAMTMEIGCHHRMERTFLIKLKLMS